MTSGNGTRTPRTAYEVLGVCADASQEEIKAAYRKAALRVHPDKTLADVADVVDVQNGEVAGEGFAELQSAWEAVKDAERRAAYDNHLAEQRNCMEIAIWQDVDLDECTAVATEGGGDAIFSFPCRCGGAYVIIPVELNPEASSAVVSCDTCSLAIRVLYTVA